MSWIDAEISELRDALTLQTERIDELYEEKEDLQRRLDNAEHTISQLSKVQLSILERLSRTEILSIT